MFSSLVFVSLLSAGAFAHPTSQLEARTLSNTAQTSGFSTFDLLDIPGPSRSYTTLDTIPSNCAAYTGSGQECEVEMQAFNVVLGDCGTSWTLCRCTNANIGLEEAIDHLARVPIGLRRNVGTVMIMPDTSTHAYTLATDIHFFGVCSQRTWIHESTHASDHGHSASTEWIDAVDSDSCVPDSYSQTNYVEDFAQVSVLEVYWQYYGELPSPYVSTCMPNQFAYMKSLDLYNNATLFGETCDYTDSWTSVIHTAAPATETPDQIITGSYTTLTAASTVTASSGSFGATVTTSSAVVTSTSTSSQCAGASTWSSSVAYVGGSQVIYDGELWTAQWWTEDDTPGGVAGVWVAAGTC